MRARAGTATLPEAVRLLKEYPEMGSIEVANFYHLTGDHSDLMNAWHSIIGMSVYLKDHFNDAEVTLSNEESMTPSDLVIGTEVKKRVLVTIRSSESYSELVVKLPFLSLSDKNPVLGITAYLRDRSHTTASDPAFSVDTLHPEQVESLGTMDPNKARYILERLSQVAQQLRD